MKRIRNIGGLLNPLSIHMKGGFGNNDSIFKLPEGMEMWTSMDLDRYSIMIYTKKKLIVVDDNVEKPNEANENEAYPIGHFDLNDISDVHTQNEPVQEIDFSNVENKNGDIRFIKKEEDVEQKMIQKEEVPDVIIESLINDSIKRSIDEGIVVKDEVKVVSDISNPILPYVKPPFDPNDYEVGEMVEASESYEEEKKEYKSNVDTRKKWTEEEEEILRKGYPKNGLTYCLKKLPHRSHSSIKKKIETMQLRLEKKKK